MKTVILNNISVVIPTLGENTLKKIIYSLNNGSLIPKEIILSVPKNKLHKIKHLRTIENIVINITTFSSQVFQRCSGFRIAKSKFVLQLDSDIVVKKKTLEILLRELISLGDKSSISPSTGTFFHKKNFLKKVLFGYFIKREKKLDVWDTWYDNDFNDFKKIIKVKWLPGGCVLHYKKNLILVNYYPYPNCKAYDEDLLHSYYLYKKKINLYYSNSTKVDNLNSKHYLHNNLFELLDYIKKVFLIKHFIMKKCKGTSLYFYIWYIVWIVNEFKRYLKKKITF